MGFTKKGKKALVILLAGPMKQGSLAKKAGITSSSVLANSLARNGYVQPTSRGLMLTEKGTRQAVAWDYELKLKNDHPSQETTVERKGAPSIVGDDGGLPGMVGIQPRSTGTEDSLAWKREAEEWKDRYVRLAELMAGRREP